VLTTAAGMGPFLDFVWPIGDKLSRIGIGMGL